MKSDKKILLVPLCLTVAIITTIVAVTIICNKKYDRYLEEITCSSEHFCLDAALVFAVIDAESSFNPNVRSYKNAIGLMQITPSTAIYIAQMLDYNGEIHLSDPVFNIRFGCAYLQYLSKKFESEREILCAYNAGEGNVLKWLKDKECSTDGKTLDFIPFAETRAYVAKVLEKKKFFASYLEKKGYYERQKNKRQSAEIFSGNTVEIYFGGNSLYYRLGELSHKYIQVDVPRRSSRRLDSYVFGKAVVLGYSALANF